MSKNRIPLVNVTVGAETYPAGKEVPAEVAKQIDNPKVWAAETAADPASGDATEPPRGGEGSGLDAWTEYAEKLGLTVPEGASRDDVIALVDDSK